MRLNAPIIPVAQSYKRVAPMSYQEMAYAPALMQQRHEAANAQLLEDEEGLQFDYLQKDDPIVRKRVKEYQDRLTDLSTKLAKSGVGGIPIRQELMKYKKDFIKESGQQGILGQAQQNYKDATTQWQEWKKANPKASQQYQQKAKQHFYSKYEGMQDEDGNYRGFTPGDIVGEIDIPSDFTKFAKEAGYTPEAMKQMMYGVQFKPVYDKATGIRGVQVIETQPGSGGSSNAPQLQKLANEWLAQYKDNNTTRGKYKEIAEISDEDLARTISNMQGAMTDIKGGTGARQTGKFINTTNKASGSTRASKLGASPTFTSSTSKIINPRFQKEADSTKEAVENYFDSTGAFSTGNDPKSRSVDASKYSSMGMLPPSSTKDEILTKAGIAAKKFNDYKDSKFKSYYSQYKNPNKELIIRGDTINTDKEWFEAMNAIEQNEAVNLSTEVGFDNYDFHKDIINKSPNPRLYKLGNYGDYKETEFPKTETEGLKNSKPYEQIVEDIDMNYRSGRMDSKGNIIMSLPTGKGGEREDYLLYTGINVPNSALNAVKEMTSIFTNYNLGNVDLQKAREAAWEVGDKIFKVHIDENDPTSRVYYYREKIPVMDPDAPELPLYDISGQPVYRYGNPTESSPSELLQAATYVNAKTLTGDKSKF